LTDLLDLLRHSELNGIRNKFGVLLNDLLDLLLLQVLELVLLEEKSDFGTSPKRRVDGVGGDGESATSSRLPDILFVVVVFRDNLDTLGDEIRGVETNTELTDHRNIGARAESLHEALEGDVSR
jgi:hypothetical protein